MKLSQQVAYFLFYLLLWSCMEGDKRLFAQQVKNDLPYVESHDPLQVLDVYAPSNAKNLPVIFWIHGGGWQAGDKAQVFHKPKAFLEKDFVFVSTNYRLLPAVAMESIIQDIAKAIRWVHDHIAEYGGDPKSIYVMGHSAGAQLAAIVCTDDSYLKSEGLSFSILKGCVPVDGDTFDIPAIITTAEIRCQVHGLPQPKNGHRVKFGNDPLKHLNFSAVTHIAPNKGIPPFQIIFVQDHPDTGAQAKRLDASLQKAGVPVSLVGGKNTTHTKINDDLGLADDPVSTALFEFVGAKKSK